VRLFIEFRRRTSGPRYPDWSLRVPIEVSKEDVKPLIDSWMFGAMIWNIAKPKSTTVRFKKETKKWRRGSKGSKRAR
jgi:hypothetical protein